MNKVIQPIHVYSLLFLSVSFLTHFILIPTIFTVVEREAWISALASLIPIFLFALFISRITSSLNQVPFLELSSFQIRPLYFVIITSCIFYLISSTFVSLKFTIIWAEESFNSDYPYFITVILFILICYYCSLKGIKTIAIQSLIICTLYIFLFVLLNLGNSMNNEYDLILPVNTSNTPSILWGILYICIGILEVGFILILLNGYVKARMNKGIIVFSILFVFLVFITIVTTISEFGIYVTQKMVFPINEQWRVLSFGKYFTRMDSLSVLQILSMAFIRICLFMYLVSSFFKNRKLILFIFYLCLTIGLLIPWSVTDFLSFIKNFYLLFIFVFLFLFITGIYVLEKKQKGVKNFD